MAEFLIQAKNETAEHRYWRGDVINVYPDGRCTGVPATGMVIVKVPGLSVETALARRDEWTFRLSFTVTASNLATDQFTIKAEATQYNPNSGVGRLTAGQIESYLTGWGAKSVSFANYAVTYDIAILDAIKSSSFWWGRSLTGLALTQVEYAQVGGVHRCLLNYSGSSASGEDLADLIESNGGTLVAEDPTAKTITFDISRATVRDKFERDVRRRVERMLVRRRYRVTEAALQWVEAQGRVVTVTVAAYNGYWSDRLAE